MSASRVEVKGLNKTLKFLFNMPKKIDRNMSKTNEKFMEDVKNDAKKMAPKDTTSLADDIKRVPVRKGKNVKIWKISVDNQAAAPQEFEFTPHFAPVLNSSKMPPGVYFVRKNTPFLRPAIEKNLSMYSQNLNNATRRAITR